MTRSPGLNAVTPAPTLSTTPANSPPGENGNGGLVWYLPAMISVSKKLSPTAATLATTSPGPATGSGISASTRSSGVPKRWQRMAFTRRGLLERCRHAIARTTAVEGRGAVEVLHASSGYYDGQRTGRSHSPSHCRIPQAVHAVCGFPASDCCSRHGGGPMTGMRSATALILAISLASVAFAQQQPQKPAAAPQPQKPPAAPSKPAPTAAAPAAPAGDAQPTLLGQYGDWGAYTASPGGNKVCFALAKPKTTKTEPEGRKRDPSYVFVSTRPTEKVKNEVSVIIGYPFKTNSDATAEIGTAKFAMYTQNDGAWIKNVAEEARMVDAMRKGADLTVKGTSGRGTQSTDQYSLKGLAQALDKAEQECK